MVGALRGIVNAVEALERDEMIAEVNEITGRHDCQAVVAVQQRPPWALPALAAVLIPLMVVFSRRQLDIVDVLVIAGIIAGYFLFTTSNYWFARCGESIVLVELSRWRSHPIAIVKHHDYPLEATVTSGRAAYQATIVEERFLFANAAFEDFQEVTGLDS